MFGPVDIAAENTISLAVAALYGLFAYVRGQETRLRVHASHPDPLLRAIYTRDFVYQIMQQKRSFDEMNDVLVSPGLITSSSVTDEGIDTATDHSRALKLQQYDRGKEASRYAFIERDQ
ncbi:MAG: hypothetical protein JKY45_04790 [Emcibacter sp.]|nr:hypothetical protein [Emcibacter sp.]